MQDNKNPAESSTDDKTEAPQEGKFLVPAKSMIKMTERLIELETFVARRFDELSMEINATSQQMDFQEEEFQKQFSEVMDVMKAVAHTGDGNTAANTGVELAAVVDVTEKSANDIIDATERIRNAISEKAEIIGNDIADTIVADLDVILMACEFQDITGQRIRNAVSNLTDIEDKLSSTLDKMGIEVIEDPNSQVAQELSTAQASQDDIDKLFD